MTDGTGPDGRGGPARTECSGGACVTCGDIAVEVKVLRLLPDEMAAVDTGHGTEEEVSVALVSAAPGDTILVHAGEAIAAVPAAAVPAAAVPAAAVPEVSA